MLEVDVIPGEGLDLSAASEDVDRDRVELPVPAADAPAGDELQELRGEEELLGLRLAPLGPADAGARVVLPHP
ncbi:MAG: hypothetical protein ACLQVI_22500 [Polyangiaceae bacterium]